MTQRTHTAILVFARSAASEARHKNFGGGCARRQTDRRIAQLLIDNALDAARRSGCAVHVVTEADQRGASFGERYSNAFADVFALGYDAVVSIGGDAPDLRPADIRRAVEQIAVHDMVLGPASDGGAYIVAARRTNWPAAEFASLAWETSGLFNDLLQMAGRRKLRCALLREQRDIDGPRDLLDWLNTAAWNLNLNVRLLRLIRTLLLPTPGRRRPTIPFYSFRPAVNIYGRAPPAADRHITSL